MVMTVKCERSYEAGAVVRDTTIAGPTRAVSMLLTGVTEYKRRRRPVRCWLSLTKQVTTANGDATRWWAVAGYVPGNV